MSGSGRTAIIALKKAGTWGTAVECGSDNGMDILSESVSKSIEQLPDESAGHAFKGSQDQGLISVTGSIESYLRYRGSELPLALIMGAAATPSQMGEEAAYAHNLTLADDVEGLFATLVMAKMIPGTGYTVHEVPSAKLTKFTLRGEAGKDIMLSYDVIGDDLNLNTTTGTNTRTTTVSITVPAGARAHRRQSVLRMNAASGATLTGSNKISPAAWELSFTRALEAIYTDDLTTEEPKANGFPEASLRLEFPTYAADTYLAALNAATAQKLDITITGGLASTLHNYEWLFEAPQAELAKVEAPSINRAGRFTQAAVLNLSRAASAPAGMSGLTNPLRAKVINLLTTNILA